VKIIFASPFNPLWSKGVSELASILGAEVVFIGDLLRMELKSNSSLEKQIEEFLKSGETLKPAVINDLLSQRFFHDSTSKILINYPINITQAESLAEYIKTSAYPLSACVVVNLNRDSTIEKFERQFYCENHLHPSLETSEIDPKCNVCGKSMKRSYDLKNDKLAHLIDSYFNDSGVFSCVSMLSSALGIEAISYTTPKEVAYQIIGLSSKSV